MRKYLLSAILLTLPKLFALSPLKEAEDRRDVHAPALQAAIISESKKQRVQVAQALGRIQKAEGLTPLLNLLNDRDLEVQKAAAFALGQLAWVPEACAQREKEIAKTLQKKLSSKNASMRALVAEALGKIALEEAPQYLIPLLKDTNAEVRATTLTALYRYRIILKLRDPNSVLTPLSEESVQEILKLNDDPHIQVTRALAYYFQRVRDPRGLASLLELSKSIDTWTRFYVSSALAKYDRSTGVENVLLSASEDDSAHIRTAAVQSIAALKFAELLSPALRGDPSFHVRMAYTQALVTLKNTNSSEHALEKLRELYSDPKTSVRAEALKALASFAIDESLQLVKDALNDPVTLIRVAAIQSLTNFEAHIQEEYLNNMSLDSEVSVRVAALDALSSHVGIKSYGLIQQALASEELSERGTAITALQLRPERQRHRDAYRTYQRSQTEKWVELREEIVKVWSSETHQSNNPGSLAETTFYLREAVLDSSSSVAQLAASALRERGILDFPQPTQFSQLSFSPYRELQFKKNPKVFLETNKGLLVLELFYKDAPVHVANIFGFANDQKYNGLPVHRVVSNFVVQGGDPDKSGWGSAGYSLRAEVSPRPFERGTLGMPRSAGFDTGGVQFFINHVPTPHLDGQYTAFGKITEGLEILDQLEVGDFILRSWAQH